MENRLFGEPNTNSQRSRYLIDFITGISDVSSGLAPIYSDPGVDSNSSSDQHPPNESALVHLCVPTSGWATYPETIVRRAFPAKSPVCTPARTWNSMRCLGG